MSRRPRTAPDELETPCQGASSDSPEIGLSEVEMQALRVLEDCGWIVHRGVRVEDVRRLDGRQLGTFSHAGRYDFGALKGRRRL